MGKAGRPRLKIDWETVKKLCQIHCTRDEIASFLKISHDTLARACVRENREDFATFYKRETENGKMSLRRMQWQCAGKGNVAMLIFLGKQLLGQRDRFENETTFRQEIPIANIDTSRLEALVREIKEIRQLPSAQLPVK